MVVHDKVKERIINNLRKLGSKTKALIYLQRFGLTDPQYLALVDTLTEAQEARRNGRNP